MLAFLDFPLWPPTASAMAQEVDYLYILLVVISALVTLLIFIGVFAFAIKFRRRNENFVPPPIHGSLVLEIGWTVLPFLVMLIFFVWGAKIYFDAYTVPSTDDAIDVYVVAKQWMWKTQYPDGQREINELHVPVGRKVRLTMASEDVIHSFFIPAFRLKRDVVPGRYNTTWFEATKPGRYHLFCAEYCGTEHSGMIGWVNVMEQADYENWLSGGGAEGSMASQGEKLFQQMGCSTCHLLDQQGRCPIMRGVYGSRVLLENGQTVLADESYVRESILNPNAKIVAGFKRDIMPTFQGQVSEEGILELIAYIKSLSPRATGVLGAPQAGAPGVGPTTIPGRQGANSQAVRRGERTDGKK